MTALMWLVIAIAFVVFVTGCTLIIGTHNKVETKLDREVGIGMEVGRGDAEQREVREKPEADAGPDKDSRAGKDAAKKRPRTGDSPHQP